jgi:hypothetical protein
MAGKIKHRFVSPVADAGNPNEVGPSEWNDSLVLSEGTEGQVPVRRLALSDGYELITLCAPPSNVQTGAAQNSGAGETDLMSFTLPANHLSVNNKAIRVRAFGTTAANATAKTLKLYFGSAVVTLNPVTAAPNGIAWEAEAVIIRTGVDAQRMLVQAKTGVTNEVLSNTAPTQDDGANIIIKVTGQGGANGDITQNALLVEYLG